MNVNLLSLSLDRLDPSLLHNFALRNVFNAHSDIGANELVDTTRLLVGRVQLVLQADNGGQESSEGA